MEPPLYSVMMTRYVSPGRGGDVANWLPDLHDLVRLAGLQRREDHQGNHATDGECKHICLSSYFFLYECNYVLKTQQKSFSECLLRLGVMRVFFVCAFLH